MNLNKNARKSQKIIISTIGTSLLTNQINRQTEDDWFKKLSSCSNLSLADTSAEVIKIIETLKQRATDKLAQGNVAAVRKASAELNGIYGIYDNDMSWGKQDLH